MAQADYVVANGTGAAVRSDLNGQLAAIVSNNSGASQPSTTYAYQWWANTTDGLLYIRNAANNAWITIGTLADANLGLLSRTGGTLTGALLADDSGTAALPPIAFDGDPDTGVFRAGANEFGIATNGVERVEFGTTEVVFNDGGANYDFRIEGDTNASLFFVDASADTVEINGDVTITDKIIHAGDTNTAIRFPAADIVSVETAGSERCRVDASGRLLVGTSSAGAGAVNAASIVGSTLNQSTGLISLASGGTLDLDLLGTGIVGHLYVTSTNTAGALSRTSTIFFIATRQGNNTAITALNSADGSTTGRSFTITNPSANIFRFTDTSSSACTVSMSFVGGIGA